MAASSSSTSSTSGGDPGSATSDRNYRRCLSVSAGALLAEAGFDSVSHDALETITEAAQSFLCELGRSSRSFTELACRNHPLPADVLLAMAEMGFPSGCTRLHALHDYAFRPARRCVSSPAPAQPAKTTSILHTGERKRHRPGGVVPENFVEFPDSHSYVRTPTHKQPVTDYESVREKAAQQKRDVERALTRFVAKTCKCTHSLFSTDDTNLFPLISPCADPPADQPVFPAYVSALLFKDQIFEEDESEFGPKKKKEDEEEAKKKDDKKKKKKKKEEPDEEEEKEANNSEDNEDEQEGDKEAKEKEASKESVEAIIENPFLRPARMPPGRTVVAPASTSGLKRTML